MLSIMAPFIALLCISLIIGIISITIILKSFNKQEGIRGNTIVIAFSLMGLSGITFIISIIYIILTIIREIF